MPMCWLAAKTPELAEYNWIPVSNGRALDTLCEKMLEIADDPEKILDETYMMSMFRVFIDELPPMEEYWTRVFEKSA